MAPPPLRRGDKEAQRESLSHSTKAPFLCILVRLLLRDRENRLSLKIYSFCIFHFPFSSPSGLSYQRRRLINSIRRVCLILPNVPHLMRLNPIRSLYIIISITFLGWGLDWPKFLSDGQHLNLNDKVTQRIGTRPWVRCGACAIIKSLTSGPRNFNIYRTLSKMESWSEVTQILFFKSGLSDQDPYSLIFLQ